MRWRGFQVLETDHPKLDLGQLQEELGAKFRREVRLRLVGAELHFPEGLSEFERGLVEQVVEKHDGSKALAAAEVVREELRAKRRANLKARRPGRVG